MWNISYSYFVKEQFLPFIFLLYIPVHYIAVSDSPKFTTIEWICFAIYLVGLLYKAIKKEMEGAKTKLKVYLQKTSN